MRAVVGYAGTPVTLQRGGRRAQGIGLAESMRFTIAVPGRLPLHNLHFSLVDVPDLQVIPPEHPGMTDIWMGAGPVPEVLHRILNGLAHARHRFRLPSLVPFAGVFHAVLNRMKYGEHRGGMFVRARGSAQGKPVERSWHLLAEGDDGPFIPSMAIEAIVRQLLAGKRPANGARPATHALELSDYDALFGFPSAASDIPVSVTFSPEPGAAPGAERWTRTFGDRSFSSTQHAGSGRSDRLLVERFGMASFAMALVIEADRLHFVPRRWSLFGIPMPACLLPRGRMVESDAAGRFCFDIEIVLPVIGLVVAYRGVLDPKV